MREAVDERATHGFGANVEARCRGEPARARRELLQDVQDLERGDPAGGAG